MKFISGLLSGILIGFLIAVFCRISSECDDNKEDIDIEEEKDNKE